MKSKIIVGISLIIFFLFLTNIIAIGLLQGKKENNIVKNSTLIPIKKEENYNPYYEDDGEDDENKNVQKSTINNSNTINNVPVPTPTPTPNPVPTPPRKVTRAS